MIALVILHYVPMVFCALMTVVSIICMDVHRRQKQHDAFMLAFCYFMVSLIALMGSVD
jgi:hypothetical protein